MHSLSLFFSLVASTAPVCAQQSDTSWHLSGTSREAFTMTAAGSALGVTGATVSLESASTQAQLFASVTGRVVADSFRGRRVKIAANIDARGVLGGTSVWLRIDADSVMLAIDNGSDNLVKGTTTGAHREITLYVPPNATTLVFGLMQYGAGASAARGFTLRAGPPLVSGASATGDARRQVDSAIKIVKAHSLWRDTVTWARVEADVWQIAAGTDSAAEAYPAIRVLLTRLGDHHSFVMKPVGTRAFETGGAQNPHPIVRMEGDSVGFVSVFGYGGGEQGAMRQYAKAMQDSVTNLMAAGASCRWIVDLRQNTGGNMWPMLGGLRPFLGEGELGFFVGSEGRGAPWRAGAVNIEPSQRLATLESAYVAVLTGPRTASSGEAVTVAFRGRPRTRSFGLPTAGLSNANAGYRLPDGGTIFLTGAVDMDRQGYRYGDKIRPDEVIAADSTRDVQLARAHEWLRTQPACK